MAASMAALSIVRWAMTVWWCFLMRSWAARWPLCRSAHSRCSLSHGLLKLSAAFAFEFGHCPLVVAQTVLVLFHGFGMRIERVAVLANDLLQLRQFGQRRFVLCPPPLDIDAPCGMHVIPLPVIGLHVFECAGFLIHRAHLLPQHRPHPRR